jgi:mono/diheme cytochrome c family protein
MSKTGFLAMAAMVAACCIAGVGGARAQPAPAASAVDPVPGLLKSPADVARGRNLFAGTCGAYCHKMTPVQADAPFLFDCDWLFGGSDAQVFHTITHGVPGTRMVAFGGAIPDADIWRIVAYLKSASLCKK